MALSAVLLPAPLGPIRPRMRPDSTRRSRPSRATVDPNLFLSPRASMHVMGSTPSPRVIGSPAGLGGGHQLLRRQAEPLDGRMDRGPLFSQEFLAFAPHQK